MIWEREYFRLAAWVLHCKRLAVLGHEDRIGVLQGEMDYGAEMYAVLQEARRDGGNTRYEMNGAQLAEIAAFEHANPKSRESLPVKPAAVTERDFKALAARDTQEGRWE